MKKIYLLGLLPVLLNAFGAVTSTRNEVFVGGIPALLLWVIGSVLLTSLVLLIIYRVDLRSVDSKAGFGK